LWAALHNTQQWKQMIFYLPGALFGNRQQGRLADLRLVDGYDGVTNYSLGNKINTSCSPD
jgi:hypothetical protein